MSIFAQYEATFDPKLLRALLVRFFPCEHWHFRNRFQFLSLRYITKWVSSKVYCFRKPKNIKQERDTKMKKFFKLIATLNLKIVFIKLFVSFYQYLTRYYLVLNYWHSLKITMVHIYYTIVIKIILYTEVYYIFKLVFYFRNIKE